MDLAEKIKEEQQDYIFRDNINKLSDNVFESYFLKINNLEEVISLEDKLLENDFIEIKLTKSLPKSIDYPFYLRVYRNIKVQLALYDEDMLILFKDKKIYSLQDILERWI